MKNDFITIKVNGILIRIVSFIFPVFLILFLLYLQGADYQAYCIFIREDNVIENMTSFFYLLASIVAVCIAVNFIKKQKNTYGILYILLSIGFFIVFGDEISWGQRFLNRETSGFFLEHNLQGEINLHNLDYFRKLLKWFYIMAGLYGSLLWLITIPLKRKLSFIVNPYFIPCWYLMSYFFTVSAFYIYFYFISQHLSGSEFFQLHLTWREQEPAEFILSMGFLLFVIINRFRQIQELNLSESRLLTVKWFQ